MRFFHGLTERGRLTALFVLGILAGVVVVGVVYAAVIAATTSTQIRDTQENRAPQNAANDETLAIIKDCTQPTGKCYRDGQRRTAQVLSDVSRIIILAAACAVDVSPDQTVAQRQAAITACITDRIARDDR